MTIIQDGEFKGAIVGTDGNDALQESGIIFGIQGNDILFGNGGNDTLYAGKDNDIVYAGVGDTCIFSLGHSTQNLTAALLSLCLSSG